MCSHLCSQLIIIGDIRIEYIKKIFLQLESSIAQLTVHFTVKELDKGGYISAIKKILVLI
jgi:hypothetical protein